MGAHKHSYQLSLAFKVVLHSFLLLLFPSSSQPAPEVEADDRTASLLRRGLDGNAASVDGSSYERMHHIRRIYGEDNASVRAQIRMIESGESGADYWKTGIRSDPDHRVKYANHPFERRRRRRQMEFEWGSRDGISVDNEGALAEGQGSSDDTGDGAGGANVVAESAEEQSLFRPLRIHFDTSALEEQRTSSLNGDRIDFVTNEILPRMVEFWSRALSVIPVSGPLEISRGELVDGTHCGDPGLARVPSDHVYFGVPDADLVLYASGSASSKFCGPQTMAVAVACNADQWDRPIAGAVNFCLGQIGEDALAGSGSSYGAARREELIDDFVVVAIHEAGHVLGMSSNSYRYFRHPATGEPRTARPFQRVTATCVDGTERSEVLPDESTVKFFEDAAGRRRAEIVTERVAQVARNQFDCQRLEGAPLENQPTSAASCMGDHWDERLFYPEALSGIISPTTNILSPLTLALLEDSGWYLANYSTSRVSPWGHGAGCKFVRNPCLTQEVDSSTGKPRAVVPDYGRGYFCAKEGHLGCSPAHTHRMACTVINYALYNSELDIDPPYQYFPGEPHLGGPRQADYCPVYGSSHSGLPPQRLDCTDPNNLDLVNMYAESYGDGSMCFETSAGGGRCHTARCILSDFTLKVYVRGEWHTCRRDFQRIDVRVAGGTVGTTITCPRLSAACPDMFCPANCAGRGVCVFPKSEEGGGGASAANDTMRPRCAYFNSADALDDATNRDGRYVGDDSELESEIPIGCSSGGQENVGFFGRLKNRLMGWDDDTASWREQGEECDKGFFGRLKEKIGAWTDKGMEELVVLKDRVFFWTQAQEECCKVEDNMTQVENLTQVGLKNLTQQEAGSSDEDGEDLVKRANGTWVALPSQHPSVAPSPLHSTASSAIPSALPSAVPSNNVRSLVPLSHSSSGGDDDHSAVPSASTVMNPSSEPFYSSISKESYEISSSPSLVVPSLPPWYSSSRGKENNEVKAWEVLPSQDSSKAPSFAHSTTSPDNNPSAPAPAEINSKENDRNSSTGAGTAAMGSDASPTSVDGESPDYSQGLTNSIFADAYGVSPAKPPAGENPCAGKKPDSDFNDINCMKDGVVQALEQSGTNVTIGYKGTMDTTGRQPITTSFFEAGLCPVNVHWHLGAEHYSGGEFDENGTGPSEIGERREAAGKTRLGYQCRLYSSNDPKFNTEYDWKHCIDMEVGQTYEVHWPHSAAGACGTINQYQTPFYDGMFCIDGIIRLEPLNTYTKIGVQSQVFTIVNDEDYYYPDLMRGMIVDAPAEMGIHITKYTGSTTGTSLNNNICSQYTPITWQVDRKCHLVSASTFDKMCADMKAQRDDMTEDLYAHGSREIVVDKIAANNHQNLRRS